MFHFTEEQVVEAARKAFRDYSAWSQGAYAAAIPEGATPELWADAETESDALGEALKVELCA